MKVGAVALLLAAVGPPAPAAAGDLAWITAQNAGRLAIIDLASGETRAQAILPGKPAAVACLPAGRGAAVVEAETGQISLIAPDGRAGATTTLPGAFGIAASADGAALYVSQWDAGRLTRLGPDLAPLWSVPAGPTPTGVDVSPDDRMIAVAERDRDSLSIFDTADGRLLHRVAVGAHPFGVTFHDTRIYVAEVEADAVSVVDPASGRVTGRVPTGDRPYAIAFSGGAGFVTNQYDGTLTRFDPVSLTVTGTLSVGDTPEGIAAASDGRLVVANWFSNTLSVLAPAEGSGPDTPPREIDTPDGPRAFGRFVCPAPAAP